MSDFHTNDRVRYVPGHAYGDHHHPDCELGTVSSVSPTSGTVFVKFDKQVSRIGWEGTTAQGCNPEDLVKV